MPRNTTHHAQHTTPVAPPQPPDPARSAIEDHSLDFKLERYKYILEQIHALNNNMFQFLRLFQALAVAIVGGGITLLSSWKSLAITPATARVGVEGLLILLLMIAGFVSVSLVAGLFSWIDYRKEEATLLDDVVCPGYRKPPRLRNFWRWYETYSLLFILIVVLVIYLYTENQVMPLIK